METEIRRRSIKDTDAEPTDKEEIEAKPKYWDPLTDGIKWIEGYAEPLEKFFERLPEFISTIVATLAVFAFGSVLRGEWVLILVSALKQISGHTQSERNLNTEEFYKLVTLENLKMDHFAIIFIMAHVVSFSMYFLVGGFLHWYFYIKRRHLAHEWKIQPDKWISPELERHEILLGTLALLFTNSFSAIVACYIMNGNPSTVYYQFDEYGWLWFFLQFPLLFIVEDYVTYILHRLYHLPFLYKNFHKLHHKYKVPTAFSVVAIHPVEILHMQAVLTMPLFLVPVHWLPFCCVAMYNYYHGIIVHSGVHLKSHWWQPWQPEPEFHDKHHQFFHCNFGFNMTLWDKLHGTVRREDRVYTEHTYVGQAPPVHSAEGRNIIATDPDADTREYYGKYIKSKASLND